MERSLIIWLFSLGKEEIWMAEKIKEISKVYHVTVKSLENYLLNSFDYDKLQNNSNNYNNSNHIYDKLIKKITPLFEKCNGLKFTQGIVYKINHGVFNRFNIIDNNQIFFICLEIIANNKKLLIKNDEININNQVCDCSCGILFLNKIWRNILIKNEILYHCKIYRNHRFKFIFSSISSLINYKFKEYLNYVEFKIGLGHNNSSSNNKDDGSSDDNNYDHLNDYLEFKLPSSVRILKFDGDFSDFIRPYSLPSTIKTLIFNEFDLIQSSGDNNDTGIGFKKLDNITIKSDFQAFYSNIPNGVKSINHYQHSNLPYEFIPTPNDIKNQLLLPNSIKSIKIENELFSRTNKNCFDIIQINELPSSIELFSFNFTVNHKQLNFIGDTSIFPNSLTDLNLTYLSLVLGIDVSIKKCFMPPQLKRLNIGGYYGNIEKDVLPKSLQSLVLPSRYTKTIHEGCLPTSLEYLSFNGLNCNISLDNSYTGTTLLYKSFLSKFNDYLNQPLPVLVKGSIPINLKTLKLSEYQCFLDILVKGTFTENHKSLTKLSINPVRIYDYKIPNLRSPLNNQDEIDSKINNWENNGKFTPPSLTKITCFTNFNPMNMKLLTILPISKIKINTVDYKSDLIPPSVTNIVFLKNQREKQIKTFPNGNKIKSVTIRSNIGACRFPESLETLYCSNFNYSAFKLGEFSSHLITLKNLKKLIIFDYSILVDLKNIFPNLEILVIIGKIDVFIKNYYHNNDENDNSIKSNLKKIFISNSNINFLDNNPNMQPIIQVVENLDHIKKIKHLII